VRQGRRVYINGLNFLPGRLLVQQTAGRFIHVPGLFMFGYRFNLYQCVFGKLADCYCGAGGFSGEVFCVNFVKDGKVVHVRQERGIWPDVNTKSPDTKPWE
jgi:hypothetical protein